MKISKRFNLKSCVLTATLVILSACSSSPVKMSDKDTSGRFDGIWVISVAEPVSSKQNLPGNWIANCGWEPFNIPVSVTDGVMSMTRGESNTPVGKEGRFLLEAPTSSKATQTGGVLPGSQTMTLIFKGSLDEGERNGVFTRGVAAFQNNGCKARFTIEGS